MKPIVYLVIAVMLCGAANAYADDSAELYKDALRSARADEREFAFINYDLIVSQDKPSPYRDEALFACGEYYYESRSYQDARRMFSAYVAENPEGRGVPFALAYLYKLSEEHGLSGDLNALKKQLIRFAQVSLVFREFKEFAFRSPLNTSYSARYYIDRIEMFRQGDPLAAIRF